MGKIIQYLACNTCGRSSPLSRVSLDSFERFDPKWALMHTREAKGSPGRGKRIKGVGGFQIVEGSGLSIMEMLDDPEYAPYAEAVKNRVLLIVREYLRVGAITPAEVAGLLEP